jgi:predicted PurR-regulated permease PerM
MQTKRADLASHLMLAFLILGVLVLKLVAGAIAGFLVLCVSRQVTRALERRWPDMHARSVAVALVIGAVAASVFAASLGLWQLVKGQHGVTGLYAMLADVLTRIHANVPGWLDAYLPASIDDAKLDAANVLRKNSEQVSAMGMGTLRGTAHVLVGLVAGSMLAWSEFATPSAYKPLSRALLERFTALGDAFERVVFAQVKVSLLNTVLSGLYLQVALPAFGVHVPFSKTLVAFTFFAGLLPVVGNLISNTAIVIASIGVSFDAAIASLVFLIAVHKLEYFANARIVGHRIEASAWELVIVMVAMESVFGLPGVVVAPILYAYVKAQLRQAGLVGRVDPGDGESGSSGRATASTAAKRGKREFLKERVQDVVRADARSSGVAP